MRTSVKVILLLLALLALSGCQLVERILPGRGGDEAAEMLGDDPAAMPTSVVLAVGTLKLKDTDLAVDAEQAAELLPLWKAVRSLAQANNTSTAEMDAVYEQIEETMSEEQRAAIEEMDLTRESLTTAIRDLGLGTAFRGQAGAQGAAGEKSGAQGGAAAPGGGADGGGGLRGGFGGAALGGQDLSAEERATLVAQRTGAMGGMMARALASAVIEMLEGEVGS